MSKYSIVPKPRTLFEFTIPEFKPMEATNGRNSPQQDPVKHWVSARREVLVEVKNFDGRSVIVSREALVKSRNTRESDYNYALRYIMELFDKTHDIREIKQEKPNIRLQAWFDDYGQSTLPGGSAGHFVDIDPKSWGDIWSYADKVMVAV